MLGVEGLDLGHHRMQVPHDLGRLIGVGEGLEEPDVGAGEKAAPLGGAPHQGFDVVVFGDPLGDGDELLGDIGGDGVDRLTDPVEQGDGDAVFDLEGEVFQVHRSQRSSTTAAPIPPAAHWVTSAVPASRRANSLAMVRIWRAPVAANGCPRLIDPP